MTVTIAGMDENGMYIVVDLFMTAFGSIMHGNVGEKTGCNVKFLRHSMNCILRCRSDTDHGAAPVSM